MDDITRQDRRLFLKELANPIRLLLVGFATYILFQFGNVTGLYDFGFATGGTAVLLGGYVLYSHSESVKKRFGIKRFEALWNGCLDRFERFEAVISKLKPDFGADLKIMPQTIRSVAKSIYGALRRADMVWREVHLTEKGVLANPPSWTPSNLGDPQANELYRIADKNIAEYRAYYGGVMAGCERAEAQAAVFMTTLDTLRVKILGYRLVGKSPETPSQDFLEALAEARLQLDSIDKALDELDLSLLPKMIAVTRSSASSPSEEGVVEAPPIQPDPEAGLQQRIGASDTPEEPK